MYPLSLGVANVSSGSGDSVGTEVPLLYYYVTPLKRECMATLSAVWSSSDSGTYDAKLQESATTVDSDFTDITGGAFTQLTDASTTGAIEQIFFALSTGTKYVRQFGTLSAGSIVAAATLWLVKREA